MNANRRELKAVLTMGETLMVEFKSDTKPLPDRELVAAVVALANTEGGELLLGVKDDGIVTGVHPNHRDVSGLVALIANRTNPSLAVRVEVLDIDSKQILRVQVPKTRSIVSTSEGVLLRRRLLASGKPEAVPFYPHEFVQRQSAMGLTDPSATPLTSLTSDVLNPLERQRVREAVRRYGGDASLLPLVQKAGYARQTGFDPIQQEQMVLSYIEKHGRIKRAEVWELCRITRDQAYQLLWQLKEQGKIKQMAGAQTLAYAPGANICAHLCATFVPDA